MMRGRLAPSVLPHPDRVTTHYARVADRTRRCPLEMADVWQTVRSNGARPAQAGRHPWAWALVAMLAWAGADTAIALAARPLEPPADAPFIRQIRLEGVPVFSEADREAVKWLPLGLINRLHVNTRGGVIRRELVLEPGDRYDPLLVDESERKLRGLKIFRRVDIRSEPAGPDSVDLVVRTQELWTTAVDASYEKFEDQLLWNAQIRERNLFGTARTLELQRSVDVDRSSVAAGFVDPQLFGSRWYGAVRVSDTDDGGSWGSTLARPFFRLDDDWAWLATARDVTTSPRYYVDDARFVRPDGEFTEVQLEVAQRLQSTPKGVWRGALGYLLNDQAMYADGPLQLSNAAGELDSFYEFPLDASENRTWSTLYLGLERRARIYEKLRFINAMGSVEDIAMGPEFDVRAGWTTRALRSSNSGLYLYAASSWNGWWSRHWMHRIQARAEGLLDDQGSQNLRLITSVTAHHALRPGFSFVVGSTFGAAARIDRHEVFGLGLDSGLRAARFRELSGDRLWRANAELRTIYTPGWWGLITPGLTLFGDVGAAWFEESTDFEAGLLRGAAGIGLRLGLDRAANDVPIRVDLAWPVLYPTDQASPVLSVGTGHVF